ncbi:MAG: inositol monophosphatase [Magnetococcales bacterium]|nr:inositol monophosphatase [Magnetococcales bacterium]
MNLSPTLNVAVSAAREAGNRVLRYFDNRHRLRIHEKQPNDLVTNADTEAEQILVQSLSRAYPDYGIIAEEGGSRTQPGQHAWVIDPIDGTTNFVRGIPHFAITIALVLDDEIQSALIYQPVLQELFLAEKGRGAFLNNHRIRISDQETLEGAVLATGFPHRSKEHLKPYLSSFESLFTLSGGIRRAGSAALDLAYVAAGRYDGFWEMKLAPWDIAAGILMVREAGGYTSDFAGGRESLRSGNILAANPHIHPTMLSHIADSGLIDLEPVKPLRTKTVRTGSNRPDTGPRKILRRKTQKSTPSK